LKGRQLTKEDIMKAFHNQESIKQFRLDQADFHIEHDQLLAGTYGEGKGTNFKGCSIGCHYGGDHNKAEEVDGLPEWYARLADTIFEGLPEEKQPWWHKAWFQAVPVGFSDFDLVKAKFLVYLLKEQLDLVESLDIGADLKDQVLDAIKGSLDFQATAVANGGRVDPEAAREARAAAWEAARAAEAASEARGAWAAARAAAWAAAWEAAWEAARAAARAEEAAWGAETEASYTRQAEKIISLFEERVSE
jgi:hypothetical protein